MSEDNTRGCGDHSCVTATDKSGQMTNGGCRCSPIALKKHIWKIENENRLMRECLSELKTHPDLIDSGWDEFIDNILPKPTKPSKGEL